MSLRISRRYRDLQRLPEQRMIINDEEAGGHCSGSLSRHPGRLMLSLDFGKYCYAQDIASGYGEKAVTIKVLLVYMRRAACLER
jgi:hypothetical protein